MKSKVLSILITTTLILSACGSQPTQKPTEVQTQSGETVESINELTQEPTSTPTPEMTDDEQFIADFTTVTDEETANAVFDILRNQIGFSKVKFDEQLGDSSNYSISLDGTYGCVTAMDGYYRVFIPHTDYVFYEDGEVKMTATEFSGTQMSYDEMVAYYDMAKEAVEKKLKNPNSADFPSIVTHASDIAMEKSGDIVAVQSYVDAKNSFNAVVRSKWTVQFRVTDMSTYSYELLYINIDGEKSGTYIEMD